MSKLPQVSGANCIKALQKFGFKVVKQRGSHVKLVKMTAASHQIVTVPMHKIIKKGTLRNGILRPINLSVDDFIKLLKIKGTT